MSEKRYAIVRVGTKGKHKVCPMFLENNIEEICIGRHICEQCRYGDTKEQMVKKVATAILRTLKDGEVLKYEKFGTGFIKQPVSVEYLAERIVEFLGVEE